jgi:superfamily II DNA or RNA helicase
VDEFHKSAAETYQKVFAKLPNTKYRLGLTATVKRDDGKEPILFSILNEIVCKITADELITMGFLIRPTIEFHKIESLDIYDNYTEEYRQNIILDPARNEKILEIVEDHGNKKILILTKMVAHGRMLNDAISDSGHIHGVLGKEKREKIFKDFKEGNINCLILTISIGAEGLDIPDLDVIINAAANKGDVKSIQILGRVLRKFNKKKEAIYVDFLDDSKYLKKHSKARMKVFKEQGHKVIVK